MRASPIYFMAEFFPDVQKIEYEGADSRNPRAFKHYNPAEVIEGKSMEDHLRFGIAYWHTMRGMGNAPFGPDTAVRPWGLGTDDVPNAQNRARVFLEKLGAPLNLAGRELVEAMKSLNPMVILI